MSDLKLCKDCKHFVAGGAALWVCTPDICIAPAIREEHPVYGGMTYKKGVEVYPLKLRRDESACGREAQWHEERTPEQLAEDAKRYCFEPIEEPRRTTRPWWRFWK